jgi:MFS family permease
MENKNKIILLISLGLLFTFAVEMIAPIYAIFVKNVGENMLSVGIAYAIYGIVFSTLQPFMGRLADKCGRIKFSIIANLINSIGLFGYIFVTHIYRVYLLQILLGIGSSIASPSQQAMMADITSKKKRGEEFGYIYMAMGYSSALAAVFAGVIADFISFQMVFLIGAIIALLSTVPLIKLEKIFSIKGK